MFTNWLSGLRIKTPQQTSYYHVQCSLDCCCYSLLRNTDNPDVLHYLADKTQHGAVEK